MDRAIQAHGWTMSDIQIFLFLWRKKRDWFQLVEKSPNQIKTAVEFGSVFPTSSESQRVAWPLNVHVDSHHFVSIRREQDFKFSRVVAYLHGFFLDLLEVDEDQWSWHFRNLRIIHANLAYLSQKSTPPRPVYRPCYSRLPFEASSSFHWSSPIMCNRNCIFKKPNSKTRHQAAQTATKLDLSAEFIHTFAPGCVATSEVSGTRLHFRTETTEIPEATVAHLRSYVQQAGSWVVWRDLSLDPPSRLL